MHRTIVAVFEVVRVETTEEALQVKEVLAANGVASQATILGGSWLALLLRRKTRIAICVIKADVDLALSLLRDRTGEERGTTGLSP